MSHQSGLSRGKGRHQKTVGLLKKVVSHQTVLSLWVSRGRGRYRNTRGLLKKGCVSPNCSFTLGFTWKRTISEDERSLCVSPNCSFTLGFTWKRTISEDERSLCVSPNCSFTLGFTWKRKISEDERSLCVSPNCSFTLGFTWKRTISEDERSLCVSRNCSFTLGFTWKRTISEDERSLKEGLCLPKVVFHSGFHYLIYVHIHIRDYLQRPWELTMLIGGPDLQFCRPSHKYVFVEFSFIATSNHAR